MNTAANSRPAAAATFVVDRGPDIRPFAADRTAPTDARRHTAGLLETWGLFGVTDTATLVVSELTTNAVRATAALSTNGTYEPPVIALRLSCISRILLIEVWDPSPHAPRRREVGDDAEDGRGLMIIEALADRWGYYRRPAAGGKVTWCQIALPEAVGKDVPVPLDPKPLPRRPQQQPTAALVPFQFSDDIEVLWRVADSLRALDWELPGSGDTP